MATARTKRRQRAPQDPAPKPANAQAARIEWIAGIASAAIVLGVMGFLAFEAVVKSGGIADLAVTELDRSMTQAGLAVTFEIRNAGHAAAAAVEVAGVPPLEGGSGQIVIDYIPAGASRTATLIFPRETPPEEIEVHVIGYSDP
ncbi:hypothetical protein VE25_21420 [Devosia geojensis]|uniref:TIGR02588 family protein n=1 Tax=Devosia geojensis TaxID=443610 RepID=A0A0F5FD61_9HYPH|nr:hypothetical protein [Devosia geojensis]KKB06728.1 hypothetical protein VE25_21420 [Devosia geojensis]